MDALSYGVILGEKSLKVIPALSKITESGVDGATIFATYVLGAIAADGRLSEEEYVLCYPLLHAFFGEYVNYEDCKKAARLLRPESRELKKAVKEMTDVFGQLSDELKEDLVTVCLLICSIDGKIVNMSVIKVDRLTKDYGSGRGVFDVSFNVEKGEVFGFLGPNGAGKSTTIRHLMGFSKPQSGQTQIFGKDTFDKYYEILRNVGYIPGEIALPAGLTGWEFIRMMQDLQKCRNDERLNYLLKLFKLDPSGETKRMSLGVKRKLAVVTAFMNDPDVLILDEPTSGLDPMMQEVFIEFIKSEKERGKTILLSSHIFSEVDATCDRIAIIKDGKIVSDFIADDLKHASQKNYEVGFADRDNYERFVKSASHGDIFKLISRDENKNTVTVSTDDKYVNGFIEVLSEYSVSSFSHLKETLEDYFMSYYKEDKNFGGALK